MMKMLIQTCENWKREIARNDKNIFQMKHAPDKCQRLICKCGSSELFSNPITVMENPVRYLVEMEDIDSKHP